MTNEQIKLNNGLIEKAGKSLEKNGFDVIITDNRNEALDVLKKKIPTESSIGTGGSRTLEQIGFFDYFTKERYPDFLDRQTPGLPPEAERELQRQILTADYFLCSANAVTTEGHLILIDYTGNRNAAATYGPNQRIFVVGQNKITTSLEKGMERASNIAAVLNNIRFNTSNPCVAAGRCVHCERENKLCRITTILSRCQPAGTGTILLVREDLGF
ncbi:MAG: lactate utilization protein [Fibrobacterota bacterium]|nr:lactate utilization protein [Chitinispirillaceae bacterium]